MVLSDGGAGLSRLLARGRLRPARAVSRQMDPVDSGGFANRRVGGLLSQGGGAQGTGDAPPPHLRDRCAPGQSKLIDYPEWAEESTSPLPGLRRSRQRRQFPTHPLFHPLTRPAWGERVVPHRAEWEGQCANGFVLT